MRQDDRLRFEAGQIGQMGDNAPGRPQDDAALRSQPSRTLTSFLADAAAKHPHRVAFRDQPGRAHWCGRPAADVTTAMAWEAVRRLAGYLERLGLLPRSAIGVCLANGSEACLAVLAVLEAGLTPCLLDISLAASELSAAIEAADIRAIMTQTTLGSERPAEKFCFIAAGFFRLRFLMAFGPEVPHGVADLDRVLRDGRHGRDDRHRDIGRDVEAGIVTFTRTDPSRPLFRPEASLIAATATYLRAAKLRPGDTVLNLLPPDDLKGLVTGVAATLLTGATLEAHAVFDSGTVGRALAGGSATHVVLPGWTETALVADGVPALVASTILVHEAPTAFTTRAARGGRFVDVVAFGETALLAGARAEPGRFGIDLEREVGFDGPAALLQVQVKDGGEICFRGPARVMHKPSPMDDDGFVPSGFRVARLGSVVVGVS